MKNCQLMRMLTQPDLDMKDAVKLRSNTEGIATFVREYWKIDGAWVTTDIDICAPCFLPFYFGVGCHRKILLDIPQHSLIVGTVHNVTRRTVRRMKWNMYEVQQNHNNYLELCCSQYWMKKIHARHLLLFIQKREKQHCLLK